MGKATLFLVLAAALGGSLLLASTQTAAVGADRETAGVEADVLARELAASAHRLVLGEAVTEDGFRPTAPFATRDFDGGRVVLDRYSVAGDSLSFELTAYHSGAAHRIRSAYTLTEGDFPGPLWLDTPYASTTLAPAATVSGGLEARPAFLDRRRFFDLRLESLLNFDKMTDSLGQQLAATQGPGGDLSVAADMDDVAAAYRAPTLEALYFDALDALGDGDLVYDAPLDLTGTLSAGSPSEPRIVHVDGALTLKPGARLSGNGLLLVEGGLEVAAGATLDWDGLVLVHTEDDFLPVALDGTVDLHGALLVDQLGAPPGGHMDLTVMHDHSGVWAEPKGTDTETSPAVRPWHRHTHKYDQATGGRTVYFYENGARGRFDTGSYHRTRFYNTLDFLGDEPVVLELVNTDKHGMGRLHLRLAGEPLAFSAVRDGFPARYASPDPYRTRPFPASDIEDLVLEIRSLRLLSYKPNNSNCGPELTALECGDRPQGVGNHYDRDGALTLRARRASDDALLYEAAAYWHWKESEADEDAAEEQAWRDRIENGEAFGTRLTTGPDLSLVFDRAAMRPIGERLGFLGTELVRRGTWTTHWSPGDPSMPTPH